ncbi:DUF3857 domain-containing transglutaminase family protein [Pedobacter sp.]|uniref:DUF3857 domain-containing transglutaminase family protein n=1 Tax=Pedobacter sp. TaxID=1411316 RepID=UPI003D7F67A8
MSRIIIILFLVLLMQQTNAQVVYTAANIPVSLKQNANAVIRKMETTVDMKSTDQVLISVKKVITVLNKNGEGDASIQLFYNKNAIIKNIKGEIYDAEGKLFSKIKLSSFTDESAVSRYSLFEDDRIKYFQPQMIDFPYTVVYEYEVKNLQNLLIPDWYINPDAEVAVESTHYQFICKPEDQVNIQAFHFPEKAVEKKEEKQMSYTWEALNLPAFRDEPFALPYYLNLPHIKIAPVKFSYYNSKGEYSNWKELGKWIYDSLLQSRQELNPATVDRMKELVKDATNPVEKAKLIYQYMQKKTRYISVQVGIGGFQPTQAAEVDQLGYGDCKALVNYMQSLLKAVDIPSYYCIVNAGSTKRSLDPNFASMNQANHVILCIPFASDTTWLECTSQTAPFGYLGDFTDDRNVLACTSTGGIILRTPELKTSQNVTSRKAKLYLDGDGSIKGKMTTLFKGSKFDEREGLRTASKTDQLKSLKEIYAIDNVDFSNLNFSQHQKAEPETVENCDLTIKNYASKTQNRVYLTLNLFNKKNSIPEVINRKQALYLNRGYQDIDEYQFFLPEGFVLEAKPNDVLIKNEYGTYELKTTLINKVLTYSRKFTLMNGTLAPSHYAAFVNFISQVNRNDQGKVVFNLTSLVQP